MTRRSIPCILVTIAIFAALSAPAEAKKPIQLALLAPIQIFPDSETIAGFRFNLLYGRNANMNGFDLGLVNHITGDFKGLQLGPVGWIEGQLKGAQYGIVSLATGSFVGAQLGGFNYAKRGKGLQLGLVNYAESIHGLQIGLVNIIRTGGFLPVMIIANGSF
jgi:hypothetical protein